MYSNALAHYFGSLKPIQCKNIERGVSFNGNKYIHEFQHVYLEFSLSQIRRVCKQTNIEYSIH